jgi:hypothetical protein
MRASPGNARITVDLENCQVVSPTGRVIPFKIDARRQHALLAAGRYRPDHEPQGRDRGVAGVRQDRPAVGVAVSA